MRTQREIRATSRRPALLLRRWASSYVQDRRRKRALAHSVPTAPNAPVNLQASDNSVSIQLSWQDLASDEQGFRIYRKVDGGSFALWVTLGANVTATQDFGVGFGHVYYYYLTAYNAVGESAASNTVAWVFGS